MQTRGRVPDMPSPARGLSPGEDGWGEWGITWLTLTP